MPIEITCRDTESGETQTRTITDDVVVIVAGRHYVADHQHWPRTGTHNYTIKVDRSGEADSA